MTKFESLSLKREAIESMIEVTDSMVDILKVFDKYHMLMSVEDSNRVLSDFENARAQNNKIVEIFNKLA